MIVIVPPSPIVETPKPRCQRCGCLIANHQAVCPGRCLVCSCVAVQERRA